MEYIKSPLNYEGNKSKLLDQILPLFPKNINTFYDVFCGSGVVFSNVEASKIVATDIQAPIIELLNACRIYDSKVMISEIERLIKKFSLSRENRDGFIQLREHYLQKENRDWATFYVLTTQTFNNTIKFNRAGGISCAFGKRVFNESQQEKLVKFSDSLKYKSIDFLVRDFKQLPAENITENDFVYLDPPYLISSGSYNSNWTEETEKELYKLLNKLNERNIRFSLSNVLHHKNRENVILKDWSKNYHIHKLNYNYSNCNYQTSGSSQEVLITNYK